MLNYSIMRLVGTGEILLSLYRVTAETVRSKCSFSQPALLYIGCHFRGILNYLLKPFLTGTGLTLYFQYLLIVLQGAQNLLSIWHKFSLDLIFFLNTMS